jgi:hypothetical protein
MEGRWRRRKVIIIIRVMKTYEIGRICSTYWENCKMHTKLSVKTSKEELGD